MPFVPIPEVLTQPLGKYEEYKLAEAFGFPTNGFMPSLAIGLKQIYSGQAFGGKIRLLWQDTSQFFLIKEIPWYCHHLSHAEATLLMQLALADAHLPVPRPIKNRNGELLTCLPSSDGTDRYFYAQPIIEGRHWEGNLKEARAAISGCAAMHRSIQQRSGAGLHKLRLETASDIALAALSYCKGLVTCERSSNLFENLQHAVNQQRVQKHNFIQPIHGDLNSTNFLFDNSGELCAIIDFDDAALAPAAEDLARAVLFFSIVSVNQLSKKFEPWPDRFPSEDGLFLLNAYCAAGGETQVAANSINSMLAVAAHVWCLYWLERRPSLYEIDIAAAFFNDLQKLGLS